MGKSKSAKKRRNKKELRARLRLEIEARETSIAGMKLKLKQVTDEMKTAKRKLGDEQLAQCLLKDKLRQNHRVCTTSYAMKEAAATTGKQKQQEVKVTNIPAHQLQLQTNESGSLGEGTFGKCIAATYMERHKVCVKIMKRGVMNEAHLSQEARVLTTVGDHKHIPYCFGVCRSNLMLVMSLHMLNGKPLTLDAAIEVCGHVMQEGNGVKYLYQTASAIAYMHEKGYLHNDIKGNNIILDGTQNGDIKAILIDYGKACHQTKAKRYNLTAEERQQHKVKYPQIAPDLRDGLVAQNVKTDTLALGRMINTICKLYGMLEELHEVATSCLAYASQDRPELKEGSQALQASYRCAWPDRP